MTECSLLGVLTLLVLTVTAGVIAWYTVETYRLRREAQLQTELQNRPFVSLSRSGDGIVAKYYLTNIGRGVARSIRIQDTVVNTAFELRSELITHLPPGDAAFPKWRVLISARVGEPRTELKTDDPAPVANLTLAREPVTLVIEYASIVGQRYRTTIEIRTGIAEIIDDRRI